MKPRNFPERKRQRRLRALARGPASDAEVIVLHERTASPLRDIRTKKDRSDRAAFRRA